MDTDRRFYESGMVTGGNSYFLVEYSIPTGGKWPGLLTLFLSPTL